jgi:hypothetical protein
MNEAGASQHKSVSARQAAKECRDPINPVEYAPLCPRSGVPKTGDQGDPAAGIRGYRYGAPAREIWACSNTRSALRCRRRRGLVERQGLG